MVLLVLDNSSKMDEVDEELIKMTDNCPRIIIINKNDLSKKCNYIGEAIEVSMYNQEDRKLIINKIKQKTISSELNDIDASYIGSARQIGLIKSALNNLKDAISSIENGMPVDIINVDITNAYLRMCDVIGEGSPEDIINNLFSNFCLGK